MALEQWRGRPGSPLATSTRSQVSCALLAAEAGVGVTALRAQSRAGAPTGRTADGPRQPGSLKTGPIQQSSSPGAELCGPLSTKVVASPVATGTDRQLRQQPGAPHLSTWPVCPQVGGDTPQLGIHVAPIVGNLWGRTSVLAWHLLSSQGQLPPARVLALSRPRPRAQPEAENVG